jgi:hypothetical protein
MMGLRRDVLRRPRLFAELFLDFALAFEVAFFMPVS